MKVITWNVNGIRARHDQLRELMAAEQPDIVCLQEIKAPPDKVPALLVSADDYWCIWHGAGGYSGVALLARRALCTEAPAFHHPAFDMEQRIVVAELGGVTVASVYVPNGGKDYEAKLAFLDGLIAWAGETAPRTRALLLCGDLNVALEERDVHPKERKVNQIGTRPEERARLTGLIGQGMLDVHRSLNPDDDQLFTWWAPWRNLRQRNIGWRIDYVLATCAFGSTATSARCLRSFGTSDHAPVVVTFS
jgi:exodeoxyribonuclease-3